MRHAKIGTLKNKQLNLEDYDKIFDIHILAFLFMRSSGTTKRRDELSVNIKKSLNI